MFAGSASYIGVLSCETELTSVQIHRYHPLRSTAYVSAE